MPTSMIQEIRRKLPIRQKSSSPSAPGDPQEAQKSEGSAVGTRVFDLPIADIIPNRSQPRSCFNQNAILRLSDSIRQYGILQPLTVRKMLIPAKSLSLASRRPPNGDISDALPTHHRESSTYLPPSLHPQEFSGTDSAQMNGVTVAYELIAGERRLRAAKLAGLTSVPCIIVNTDDSTSAELAIIENLLREDLNMFEQAEAFRRLIDEFMLTQEEVARRVSLSQSAVANKLRILRLTRFERQEILQAGLTERHARALLKLTDESVRLQTLGYIIEKKLNVSSAEAYIDRIIDEVCRNKRHAVEKETPIGASSAARVEQPLFCPQCKANTAQNPADLSVPAQNPSDFVLSESPKSPKSSEAPGSSPLTPSCVRKGAIRDIRLFYNSVRNAAVILEQTGLCVELAQSEQEDCFVLTATVTHPGS